jgi:sulfate adenylyltransferase
MSIKPHGGRLIDLQCKEEEKAALLEKARTLPQSVLSDREIADYELMSYGVYSPLNGFMTEGAYKSVVSDMHLPNGLPWSLPIVHAVTKEFADKLNEGDEIVLVSADGNIMGIMEVAEKFGYDKKHECENVYRTTDENHPGVAYTMAQPDVYLGGPVTAINRVNHDAIFERYLLTPIETRYFIKHNNWDRVVAFQTRNPIHRAHEYLLKTALEMVDALMIHPLTGATKKGDIPADVRMKCYEVLIENYFPKGRAYLSVFPAAMRYAGPREAIFHALCRKNYGFTHFIVGRDHAGVGDYYGTYDAQTIFKDVDKAKLDITPVFFEHSFYSKALGHLASSKTSYINEPGDRVFLSGTKVREMLKNGEDLPEEFTRPEISTILKDSYKNNPW